MPWLIKESPLAKGKDALLMVHVPRCGGTSLSNHFKVPQKARQKRCCFYKVGMLYFFYRYKLLESANYPYLTWENLYAIFSMLSATAVFLCHLYLDTTEYPAYVMWSTAALTFICSTFVFVAPVTGRNTTMRRLYAFAVGKLMCGWTSSVEWLTGCNHKAWLIHMTAEKIIRYDYVDREDFERVSTFAIVRNPYSRMVSVYMYNRMGPSESFKSFVKAWYKALEIYRQRHVTEEWEIYCHALPMHEFTHERTSNGEERQLVQCIIKQEELRSLHTSKRAESFSRLPPVLLKALEDMPHSNKRVRPKPWSDYYDDETQELVLRMYSQDFAQFGYSTAIPKRPDLYEIPLPQSEVLGTKPYSQLTPARVNKELPVEQRDLPSNILNPKKLYEEPSTMKSHSRAKENEEEDDEDDEDDDSATKQRERKGSFLRSFSNDPESLASNPSIGIDTASASGISSRSGRTTRPIDLPEEETARDTIRNAARVTLCAPIVCMAPLSDVTTLEGLRLLLGLSLFRRALWLTVLLVSELALGLFLVFGSEMVEWERKLARITDLVNFSAHFILVPLGWTACYQLNYGIVIALACWLAVCSLLAAANGGFLVYALSTRELSHSRAKVVTAVLALVFSLYYASFCLFYSRVAHCIRGLDRSARVAPNTPLLAQNQRPAQYVF